MQNQVLKESEAQKTIASFQKNALEHLNINLRRYNNEVLVDFRLWLRKPENDVEIPLKKGFSLKLEQYAKFREAIAVLDKELEGKLENK